MITEEKKMTLEKCEKCGCYCTQFVSAGKVGKFICKDCKERK